MRFIELTIEEHQHLTLLYKTSQDHRERQRAQALLLSARHYSICELAALFDLDRDTISRWMNRWQQWLADSQKAPVLRDQCRSGRPAVLSAKKKRDRMDQSRNPPHAANRRAHSPNLGQTGQFGHFTSTVQSQ